MIRTVKPLFLYRRFYKSLIWEIPVKEKIVFLTFDDGPAPGITDFVLDTLSLHKAKATFFCIGQNIDRHPELFQRIHNEGHGVGNHTYHHLNGWKTSDTMYLDSAERTRSLVKSKLFRPPYGRIRKSQIELLLPRYSIVMWNVLSYDYDKNVSSRTCYNNIVENTQPGSIIVMHDSIKAEKNVRTVLPDLLEHFIGKGFRFEAITL